MLFIRNLNLVSVHSWTYLQFSGYFVVLALINFLTSTLDFIVMQMRNINREEGY